MSIARPTPQRRMFLQMMLGAGVPLLSSPLLVRGQATASPGRGIVLDAPNRCYRVYPDAQIQDALERAAKDPVNKTVFVHAGTYRPAARGQALVWFNRRHDGIRLEAVGDVTLTAANPDIADRRAPSFPAVVNHVVYFGDGVSNLYGDAWIPHYRCQQFCQRLGAAVPHRERRRAQDVVFLRRWWRHQGLRAVVSRHRTRRGREQLCEPVRGWRLGRAPGVDA